MKSILFITAISLLGINTTFAQTKKVGITNFSISGFVKGMDLTGDKEADPDLYFIGEASTQLSEGVRVSDEIVKYTEASLKTFLGYDILATNLIRPANVPDEMMGNLMVMETITDKKAFTQLGYDEVIEIQCRIGSAGRTPKHYKAFIELTIKVTGKDGKTIWKKREKLKLEDKIPTGIIEMREYSKGLDFSKLDDGGPDGIPATQLLDWYKQVLGNLLIKE